MPSDVEFFSLDQVNVRLINIVHQHLLDSQSTVYAMERNQISAVCEAPSSHTIDGVGMLALKEARRLD
jgi:hypothetical protein